MSIKKFFEENIGKFYEIPDAYDHCYEKTLKGQLVGYNEKIGLIFLVDRRENGWAGWIFKEKGDYIAPEYFDLHNTYVFVKHLKDLEEWK